MKVIYIVSEYFAPDNEIGAIRFTKISKYLAQKGYRLFVFTKEKKRLIEDPILSEDLEVIKSHDGKIYAIEAETTRMFDHFMAVTGLLCEDVKNVEKMIYCGKKFAKRQWNFIVQHDIPRPDVVMTTYGDWGGHYLGIMIKEKYGSQVKWIADFRDPMKGIGKTNGMLIKCREKYEDSVIEQADVITVIADEMKEHIIKNHQADVRVIKNGFDSSDLKKMLKDSKALKSDKFQMIYTGTLYTGPKKRYDLTPFFKALSELIEEKHIAAGDLCIQYAGKHFEEFQRQLADRCRGVQVINHSFVDRKTALQLQANADILLLASWNTNEDKGQVTGKIFEYFMMKRPVVALVSGDAADSVVKEMIMQAECGFCYEEASMEKDFGLLKNYIFRQYSLWKKNEKLDFKVNDNYIVQFEYSHIANIFENIMNQ